MPHHLKVSPDDLTFYNLNKINNKLLPNTPLYTILLKLKNQAPFQLTVSEIKFLNANNIKSVILLSNQKITFSHYKKLSKTEQNCREKYKNTDLNPLIRLGHTTAMEKQNDPIALQKHLELKAQVASKIKEQEEKRLEEHKKYLASPQYKIDQQQEKERLDRLHKEQLKLKIAQNRRRLQQKYFNHEFLEFNELKRITLIAEKFEKRHRISQADAVWIFSHNQLNPTDEFLKVYHCFEAKDCIADFHRTKNKWKLINASSQYRKGLTSQKAKDLLLKYNFSKDKESKLRSAYHTTFGGVERDLANTDEALKHAKKAHQAQSKNFRPCTLFGAIYMEDGNYTLGLEWYEKAKERGAPERGITNELSIIIKKLKKDEQLNMLKAIKKKSHDQYQYLLRFVH